MSQNLFAALGEPNRFQIVELLRAGARSVNDIGGRLNLRQSQVSQHLKVLKAVGLVDVRASAQQRLYGLRGDSLKELHDWLEGYRCIWEERFTQLDDLVDQLNRQNGGPATDQN